MVRQLFWKEFREIRSYLVLSNLIAFLLVLYLSFDRRIPPEFAFPFSFTMLVLPMVRAPVHAVTTWKREWDQHHDLLLLSLPVRGWWLVTAKLCAALLETATLTVTIVVSVLLVGRTELVQPIYDFTGPGLMLYWTLLVVVLPWTLGTAVVHILGQLAALVSRIVPLFSSLVGVCTFAIGLWGIIRVGGLLAPLLRWLPALPLYSISVSGGIGYEQWLRVQMAPLAGALLALAGLFWLAGWLVEREIEP